MSRARTFAGRLYGDYLLASRLREYKLLLEVGLAADYEYLTVTEFMARPEPPARVLLLRHDVDTDVPTAVRMWEIERALGIRSTYFFRLTTWQDELVREVAGAGCEVGYHYEELATLMKRRGVVTKAGALALVDDARDLLRANLVEMRRRSGLPLVVLASHGDFTNARVKVANHVLLADADELRAELGIQLEAYDPALTSRMDLHVLDRGYPQLWRPSDPAEAMVAGLSVIEVLVHPRPWGGSPRANLREDVGRFIEGGLLRVRSKRP